MNRSPVELLVLARLLVAGEKGETPIKLTKDLEPMVGDRLATTLDQLEETQVTDRVKDKKGKLTAKLVLTSSGRQIALEMLGMEELPLKTTWSKLKSTHLVALALGKPGQAVGNLMVEILRAHHGLELAEKATAKQATKQATDAMAARLLGLEPGQPFSAEAILRKLLRDAGIDLPAKEKPSPTTIGKALLHRELGGSPVKNPLDLIAARSVGARTSKADDLGSAILEKWIQRSQPTVDEAPPAPIPLEDFAQQATQAAQSSPSGWFGDAKVFISHVWNTLRRDRDFAAMSIDDFKKRLIEAHTAGLIELGRADLVDAMDPIDVRESATPYLNAVYHFVRIEEKAR